MKCKHIEKIALAVSVIIIALIAGFPLLMPGIGGDIWDLNYHLLRIASVKEALASGVFPPRINPIYFDGYGYGSSLFYPDVCLLLPAILYGRGLSLLSSYKIFLMLVMVAGTLTTYYCLKFFTKQWQPALVGTYVLMLSTYYLADINNRAGIGEYIAIMLVPVLLIGIYDYFALEGKRSWCIGVSLGGMLLCHTIMAFLGCLLFLGVFVICLILPATRKMVFEKSRLVRLCKVALCTVGLVSFYIFPMIEQMLHDRFWYQTPWANAGDYTQTLKSLLMPVGVFLNTATFGVGIPVLVLVTGRAVMGKVKNKWAEGAFVLGVLLFLSTTKLVPWRILDNTPLNMIQFTYRLFPYAFVFLVFGIMTMLAEKTTVKWTNLLLVVVMVLAIVCGIWQNTYCYRFGDRYPMDDEYVLANNHYVGKGEWVPEGVTQQVFNGQGVKKVISEDGEELYWEEFSKNSYFFRPMKDETSYVLPLLYYKGYEAMLHTSREDEKLVVEKSAEGLVQVRIGEATIRGINAKDGPITEMDAREMEDFYFTEFVMVHYEGTFVQKLSNIISLLALFGMLGYVVARRMKYKNLSKCLIKKEL